MLCHQSLFPVKAALGSSVSPQKTDSPPLPHFPLATGQVSFILGRPRLVPRVCKLASVRKQQGEVPVTLSPSRKPDSTAGSWTRKGVTERRKADKGEKGATLFLMGSRSVQTWIISPSHYHLKGERKGLCERASPSSTASSSQETVCTMKEALGKGLTPEAARFCQN